MRDGQLLPLAVPRQLDHLESLQDQLRDGSGIGRRRDPEHPGQVERDLEAGIQERGPARGVQDVEQRPGFVLADPVDRLEEVDRVADARLGQPRDDTLGPLLLAADQALGDPRVELYADERAVERPGDRQGQRCLAGPEGPARHGTGVGSRGEPGRNDQCGRHARPGARQFHGEQAAALPGRGDHLLSVRGAVTRAPTGDRFASESAIGCDFDRLGPAACARSTLGGERAGCAKSPAPDRSRSSATLPPELRPERRGPGGLNKSGSHTNNS